jgi:hypothetical protein
MNDTAASYVFNQLWWITLDTMICSLRCYIKLAG